VRSQSILNYKGRTKTTGIATLCAWTGYTKQAYFKSIKHKQNQEVNHTLLLDLIAQVRIRMPRVGGRKLLRMLEPHFVQNSIEMGRDGFFDFMRQHGLLIKPRRRYVVTTHSSHRLRKYPNLLQHLAPTGTEQVLVSDITYIETDQGFSYLFLITDAFSRKIMGYNLSHDMRAESATEALQMALWQIKHTHGIIHHSDRGVQYCSAEYVKMLEKNHLHISMTEPSSPTQNAIAERVNGILKTEWIYHRKYKNAEEAKAHIEEIIHIYNTERLHHSLDFHTPQKAHEMNRPLKKHWKKRSAFRQPTASAQTHLVGDFPGIGCIEYLSQNANGHQRYQWPYCDIQNSPLVIPRTEKSPQIRPALHQGTPKIANSKSQKTNTFTNNNDQSTEELVNQF
jgi:transposase InsO family protein